jgi:hypothetical protein
MKPVFKEYNQGQTSLFPANSKTRHLKRKNEADSFDTAPSSAIFGRYVTNSGRYVTSFSFFFPTFTVCFYTTYYRK